MATNGMRELGYNYVLLDDCWGGGRDAHGNITADTSRFPSGTLKELADYVHSKGMLLGLYTDVGVYTCRDKRPGSWGHYEQDAYTWANWGIDYVKMDYCNRPPYPPQKLYAMMRDALNKTGRHMFFCMCEWGREDPWLWGDTVSNSWRVGPDHIPLWWTPITDQDPGQGQGTSNIIEHMANKSKYAGPGGWNDPDSSMPGYFWMSERDDITEFSFWALWAAPLIVATDVRYLGNKRHILNGEVIAVNQDPWGIGGDRVANFSNGGQIWSRPLSDKTWAAILYCPNFWTSADITIVWNLHLKGWPKSVVKAKVRDLWKHSDLGVFSRDFTSKDVPPHGVVMIKITPVP